MCVYSREKETKNEYNKTPTPVIDGGSCCCCCFGVPSPVDVSQEQYSWFVRMALATATLLIRCIKLYISKCVDVWSTNQNCVAQVEWANGVILCHILVFIH